MNETPPARDPEAGKPDSVFSIVLVYAILGGLWILMSDKIIASLFHDPEQLVRAGMIKGWFFVVITTLLLYALIRRQMAQLQAAHQHEMELHVEQQRSLRLLAAIARASRDAIFAKDLSGKYTLFNEAACAHAGKTLDQVLGQDDTVVFPAQAEFLQTGDRQVMTEDQIMSVELTFDTTLLPSRRTYLITKGPLRDIDGKIMGIFGLSRDITERKRAEEELRENEARFRALVEQSAAGIYIVQDNRFQYVNPHLARLAGYDSPKEMIAKGNIFDLVAPEQRDFVAEKMRQRMAGDSGESRYEVTGIRPDGGRIELELYGNLLIHDNRPAMLGLVIDITARKRAERELQRHNEELDRISRAMVGREVVMIEMKREINRLSQQLGYQTPYDLAFLDESETPASGPGA